MSTVNYDVVVLGGGAGGVAAAIRAAQLKGRVAIVEDKFLGGLCMNRGCVPFSHMLTASHILDSLNLAKEMGIECSQVSTDFSALMKRQDDLSTFMRQGVHGLLNKNGITLITGRGKLAGPGKIESKGEILSAKKIILATGGDWAKPSFPNSDLPEVINSDYLLTMKRLPQRCLLFGEGPRVIEIAQFLRLLGSKAWVSTPEAALLGNENKTIRSRLVKALQAQGIPILTGIEILSLRKKKENLEVSLKAKDKEEVIYVDVLMTLQRRAMLPGLGLETVGLDEKREFIEVNEHMQTSAVDVYAVGDLAAPAANHYSHLASAGGIVAAQNAMGLKTALDRRSTARVVFTRPQVACVGLTSKEAREAGYEVVEGAAPLSMNPLGMILNQNEGMIEVVAEKRYGEILGVHLIGEGVAEMVGIGILAINMEATLEELSRTTFPHPTLSESLAEAARDALGRAIYLP
jgi:dihydrolipoamide dehydrogenase